MDQCDDLDGQNGTDQKNGQAAELYVGMRLRMRRSFLGLGKSDFADATGLSVETLDLYERGEARISAALLFQLSRVLEVPVSWFFDGLGPEADIMFGGGGASPEALSGMAFERDSKELLDYYFDAISDPEKRKHLVSFARLLAEAGQDNTPMKTG